MRYKSHENPRTGKTRRTKGKLKPQAIRQFKEGMQSLRKSLKKSK